MDQRFGGPWTLIKLDILNNYLDAYMKIMQKQKFKLCYIDAFAGSGHVNIRYYGDIPGSALRAIDYPFNKYIFIEKEQSYANALKERIKEKNKSA